MKASVTMKESQMFHSFTSQMALNGSFSKSFIATMLQALLQPTNIHRLCTEYSALANTLRSSYQSNIIHIKIYFIV